MGQKLLRHADAVVLEDEVIEAAAVLLHLPLYHCQADMPAGRGELDGVAQNVGEHLADAPLVPRHVLMLHPGGDLQLQPLFLHLALERCGHVLHQPGDLEFVRHQVHIAGFQFAHIQYFVHQKKEAVAGGGDLSQAVPQLLLVLHILRGDPGHSYDAVHGRADVMAHPGEEFALGGIGVVGRLAGRLDGPLLPHLLALALRHVLGRVDDAAGLALLVGAGHHRSGPDPAEVVPIGVRLLRPLAVGEGHEGLLLLQDLAQVPAAHGVEIVGPVLRMDKGVRVDPQGLVIVRPILQKLLHVLQLAHAPHLVLLQIPVVGGEEHAAQALDDAGLLLLQLLALPLLQLLLGDVTPQDIH